MLACAATPIHLTSLLHASVERLHDAFIQQKMLATCTCAATYSTHTCMYGVCMHIGIRTSHYSLLKLPLQSVVSAFCYFSDMSALAGKRLLLFVYLVIKCENMGYICIYIEPIYMNVHMCIISCAHCPAVAFRFIC